MKKTSRISLYCLTVCCLLTTFGWAAEPSSFRFTLTGDPRDGLSKWQHTLKQMKARTDGKFAFHITAGDYFEDDHSTIAIDFYNELTNQFGEDAIWYPGVGNHEVQREQCDLFWLRLFYYEKLKGTVNPGPEGCEETTYSWDYKNAHFVQLNMYWDGKKYDKDLGFTDVILQWLKDDLDKNTKPVVFIIYHEPAFPNGRGGKDDSPPHWKRFMRLLNDRKVVAGLCAHTHTYARYQVDGDWETFTWEVDAGNAGRMSHGDKHQTFVDITVFEDGRVRFDAWQGLEGKDFRKTDSWMVQVPVPVGPVKK
ncbi:MAG: metallophosphoesterase family protein [Planctomycetota bacterium]